METLNSRPSGCTEQSNYWRAVNCLCQVMQYTCNYGNINVHYHVSLWKRHIRWNCPVFISFFTLFFCNMPFLSKHFLFVIAFESNESFKTIQCHCLVNAATSWRDLVVQWTRSWWKVLSETLRRQQQRSLEY